MDVKCHVFVQHGFSEQVPLMSVNGATNQQGAPLLQTRTSSSSSQTKYISKADAVPPVWCSTADDLVNVDDFRLAVMKNDLKLIETFLKHGTVDSVSFAYPLFHKFRDLCAFTKMTGCKYSFTHISNTVY